MADQADMKSHLSTYDGVIGLLKWGTLAVIVIVAIVIGLLVS